MSKLIKHEENFDIWANLRELKEVDIEAYKVEIAKIKSMSAPDLNEVEFMYYMRLAAALGANPALREIWAVKYGDSPAAIYCARDFYRAKAQGQLDYDVHYSEAVYTNDSYGFDIKNGMPEHKINSLAERGDLLGAYGLVFKKNKDKPFHVFVKLTEYQQYKKDGSLNKFWKTKPETMIKKVAEAQVLRMAWQGLFKGTYTEDEQRIIEADKQTSLNATYKLAPPVIKDEPEEEKTEVIEVEDENKKDD